MDNIIAKLSTAHGVRTRMALDQAFADVQTSSGTGAKVVKPRQSPPAPQPRVSQPRTPCVPSASGAEATGMGGFSTNTFSYAVSNAISDEGPKACKMAGQQHRLWAHRARRSMRNAPYFGRVR